MSEDNVKSVIEALLFASEKPLLIEQVKGVLEHLGNDEIRQIFEDLRLEYEKTNRGIRIAEVAGGFQMITAAPLAAFLKKLYKQKRIERFSKPALETLAIIAYKQPVARAEIEAIRNVQADNMVKNLLEKGLIRIAGRKKSPGRPFVYGTTRQFLEYFGLKSLEELPRMEEFANFAQKQDLEQEPVLKNTEALK